jgi:hypothetical protein
MKHRKQATPRKPKDILEIALRNLVIGDGGLFCTAQTFANIRSRIDEFSSSHQDRKINTFSLRGLKQIRRIA